MIHSPHSKFLLSFPFNYRSVYSTNGKILKRELYLFGRTGPDAKGQTISLRLVCSANGVLS